MDEEKVLDEVAEEAPAAQTAEAAPVEKKRRKRRTKAEIEADAANAAATVKRGARKAVKDAEAAMEKAAGDVADAAAKITKPVAAPDVFVQFAGGEVHAPDLANAAVAQFREIKKRTKITDLKLYIKPEERAAYYVINGEYEGKVEY